MVTRMEAQVTGPCSPYPCSAPDSTQIDTVQYEFDSHLYNSVLLDENGMYLGQYKGDTLVIQCGWIYQFNVEAGNIYEWNTDISHGVVPTIGNNQFRTKITLFYDDFETSVTASQEAVNTTIPGCAAAGLSWKANYTGTVGIMVTRGDDGLDDDGDFCACNGDSLLLRYDKLAVSDDQVFVVWGRYGVTDTLPCDDEIHYIYDSGLNSVLQNASGDYSNNENGYLVLYPGDEGSKMKLWGSCKLQNGDTLFIYNGDYSQNPNLLPHDTIVGQQQLGSEDNPIFMSAVVNQPITLRMQSDSSCTLTGLELQAKCCMNPGLPSDLTGTMTSDTSALLTWTPAEGNQIQYNWTLYSADDSTIVTSGSIGDTAVVVNGVHPNGCYFFTISVLSICSMDFGDNNEAEEDTVYSNIFCFPYFVTLNGSVTTFDFGTDSLYVPNGAYIDTIWTQTDSTLTYERIIVHETEMRVCYGNSTHICYNFPENINVTKQMIWKTSYHLGDVLPLPVDDSLTVNDTNYYYTVSPPYNLTGCFDLGPVTSPGYIILDSWTEGYSLARAILHIIVDSIPNVYLTVNYEDTSDTAVCEGSQIILRAHGASRYTWSDSLALIPPAQQIANSINTSLTIPTLLSNVYYLEGENSHHCKAYDTLRLKVNPLPELQYNSTDTVCLGDSIWLHVDGIENYTWVRLDTLNWDTTYLHHLTNMSKTNLINHMNASVSLTGYYTIYRTTILSVNADTIIIYSSQLSNSQYVDSVLGSNNFFFYNLDYWGTDHHTDIQNVIIAQGPYDSILVAPRIATDYVVSGTDTNGCLCRYSALIHVDVLPHPTILETHSTPFVCAQDTVTLSATVLMDDNHTFRWTMAGDTTTLSTDTILQFVPDTSTTVYFSMIHPNGCDTTVAFPIQVYPHPEIVLTAFPDTLCPRQQSTLTATLTGVSEWHWDDGSSSPTRVVTAEANTSYYVQATDDHGCSVIDYVSLFMYPMPEPETLANDSICNGMSDTLVLSGNALHYYWIGSGLNHNEFGDSLFVTPTVTTSYSVAYDNEYGCWDTATISVYVYNFPQPYISSDTTICRGDTVALTATGGNYFLWDDEQHSTTGTILVSPDDTTTYHVTVYDYLECNSTAFVTVNIIPYFELSITSSTDSVCPGVMVMFMAHGGEDYQWNGNGNGNTALGSNYYFVVADSTTVVSLSAANHSTNCSRTVYDTLTVFPPPEFHFESLRDTICSGDTLTIHLIGDAETYHWSSGDIGDEVVVSPTALTTYTVTAYSEHQCQTTSDYTVAVKELPADFSILVDNHVCYGDSIAVNVTPAMPDLQFIWNYPGLEDHAYTFYYIPMHDVEQDYIDTLRLAVVDEQGCQRVKEVPITVYALPRDTLFAPPSICRGDTVWLHATGQHQYFWHQPIPIIQATHNPVWHIPTSPQTYTVDVLNEHTCHITLTTEVSINELPTVDINTNGQTHFCNNGYYTITAVGAESYLWNDGQTGESISIHPMNQTAYSVTGTDANGCKASWTVSLDVDTAPALNLQVIPLDTICALDTFTLHAVGMFNHILWNTQDTAYAITRSNLTTSTWFTATATSDHEGIQCQTTDSVLVRVYPIPQLATLSNTSPICANESGTIVVAGADSYQWLPHPHLYSQEGATAIIHPEPSTESYTDTFRVRGYLDEFNCDALLTIPFFVDSLPNLNISLVASGTHVCMNDTVTLVAHGGNAHQWSRADSPGQVLSTNATLTVSPDTTTTYMLRGSNVRGCVDTAYYTVHVNELPELSVAVSDTGVCYGFPVQLTATSNATLFAWNNATSLTNALSSSTTALPLTTTTYRVTVTDATTGCQRTDSTTIIVHPSPVITSNAPPVICYGDSIGITTSGAAVYAWYGSQLDTAFYQGGTLNTRFTQMPSTSYQVIGTDLFGCKDTLPINVVVHPLPNIATSISSPGYLCHDGSQFLGITVQSNIPGTLYQWSSYPYDPTMSISQSVAFVTPDTSTTYVVDGYYIIDGLMCHAFDTAYVAVYPIPHVSASVFPEIPCVGAEVEMSATGADQYIWFADNQMMGMGSSFTVTPIIGVQYIVAGTDSNHCICRDTVVINSVNSPPVDSIVGEPSVCAFTPTVLRTSGSHHCEWWPMAGLTDVSDSSVTASLAETTTFDVYVIDEHGCRDTLNYTLNIYPLPDIVLPNDTVVCEDDEFSFRVSGATYYVWDNGSTNDFRTEHPALNTTIYSVTGTNQYGCVAADSFAVTVFPAFDLQILATRDTICIEDNAVTLTAYGAGDNYQWNTGSNDSIITVYPTATTVYTLTAFNSSSGCLSSISYKIVKVDDPDVAIQSSAPYLCLHDSALLSLSLNPDESVVWSTGETSSGIIVSPPETSTYSAVVTNGFGCHTTVTRQVDVHLLPEVSILRSDSVLCYGQSVTLTAVGNADNYQWSTGETAPSITISNVTDNQFTLTGYTPYLCQRSDSTHVTIHPLPTGIISGSSQTICPGDTVVLTLPTTAECAWHPAIDVVQSVGNSTWVNPPVTTMFTAVMTNEYGCVDSTHFTIPVYEPLPLQITPDTVICIGSGVNISVSGSWNYLWDNGVQGNSQYVAPLQTTTYSVSSTDLHDCITSVATTVTVQPDYTLTLHHDKDTICVGDSVELWYDGVVDQHYWSTGSTENHITVSPLMDATYSLWAYNTATACAKTLFDTITVIPYPVFMLSVSNLVCAGDTLAVRAFSDYHFDYHWSSHPEGAIISLPDSAEIWVSPHETTYFIYQADNHFCTLTDSVIVEVAPLPGIVVDNVTNETCMQSNGSVTVTVQSDYPPLAYHWSNGHEGASEVFNLAAGLYALTVTDALGCTNSLDGIEIVNIPPPEILVTSALGAINGGDGSIDIDVPSSYGDYTVEWFFNGWDNPLHQYDNNNSIDGLDSGYYYVMVTDEACSTTAQIFVPQLYFGQGNVYIPNTITPSNEDGMNDYFQLYYMGDVVFKEVLIYNRWGTLVFHSNDIHFKWNGAINGEIPYNNVYNVLLYYYDHRGTEHVLRSFLLVL